MRKIVYLIVFSILIFSCAERPLTIAISKGAGSESYENYEQWIKKLDSNADCIDLYFINREEALKILRKSDGLILSGGPDVHPGRYGKAEDTSRCSIDLYRDTLEFELVRIAMEMEIPIAGICRGFQVLNIANGGSLIVDIPSDTDSKVIHQDKENPNIMHNVKIFENSRLYALSGERNAMVNSNHHQGIDKLADIFLPAAASDDGLIEALEYKDNKKHFLMAVGWHPERLPYSHPMSFPLGSAFLEAARKYQQTK